MAIPSRQIGWSTKSNLLWQISKQLEYLTGVMGRNITTTTTTSSSTSSTTSSTSTSTSTSTTSTTTTSAPSTLYLSTFGGGQACTQTGPIYTASTYTYNTGTGLCDSTSFDSNDVIGLSGGTYFVSDGTNYRAAYKAPGAGVTLLTFTAACTTC
jgi:hypothetical protein